MPTHETFSSPPISLFLDRHIDKNDIVVDCFARNNQIGTFTNDLDPNTTAKYHLDVMSFLQVMVNDGIRADVIIFDPPYSIRQMKECYSGIGLELLQNDTQRFHWHQEKELCSNILKIDGKFLHFGWNTNGMGKKRGFIIDEILLVAHGGAHNDTICMAERKKQHQERLGL